jgi:hypothetical protein
VGREEQHRRVRGKILSRKAGRSGLEKTRLGLRGVSVSAASRQAGRPGVRVWGREFLLDGEEAPTTS